MTTRQFTYHTDDGDETVEIAIRGRQILDRPMINFGTAYTHEEREGLGLTGLLPAAVSSIESQVTRAYQQVCAQPDDLSKNIYLMQLQDRNEILFYRLLAAHLAELLPIIYTPTIGEAIQQFSNWFARPRGVFLAIDAPDGIEQALEAFGQGPDDVDLIVVTDSEGILGIGDQGVGGIRICVGKLSVYTAAAGVHPLRVMPVVLDVGTDNLELLNDPGYLGVRHARVRGQAYDDFVEKFVHTATRMFPKAVLHWEDFGASNAHRILQQYREECLTFNDDIQGTAAVVVAALLASVKAKGETLSEQKIVIHGAGTAGIGVADLIVDIMVREGLSEQEARKRFWCLGSRGLIHTGATMRPFQEPYARDEAELADWPLRSGTADLATVVGRVNPTVLIGTSAQPGSFTEAIVRSMYAHCSRPIILPLSNPTKKSEALPVDLLNWTEGNALMATGSPFKPVTFQGTTYDIAQANNALVFPGIGLGAIAVEASRITDHMIAAAAEAVADLTDASRRGSAVLPSMAHLRTVSATVAVKVAEAAVADGVAGKALDNPIQDIYAQMWKPEYPKVKVVTNEYTPTRNRTA
ncbi:NAD-dependent malic enzyme [Naumannella sp. ID2617S]|nr:NAD-dependent malic enzyme [Naumannella sp. ID2617S]